MTGRLGAGRPESLVRGELNPDSPVFHNWPNNTCSILPSQLVILPPRSRVIVMGRITGERQSEGLPRAILVEPVEIGSPGAYVARVISDVFVRSGGEFMVHHRPQD